MFASKNTRRAFAKGMNRALSNDEIQKVCPAVFAEAAHDSRSERYTYVPTIQVLDGLRKNGFEVYSAIQATPRTEDRVGFAKHMLRLRQSSDIARTAVVGEGVNEIILLNSHDGTSSYQLIAGHYRFVCSNGLAVGEDLSEIRIHHKGDIVSDVIDGCIRVVDNFELVDEHRELFQSITLSSEERNVFANAALQLRYEAGASPITEESILRPRRMEDKKSDLWTTFNVLQENMIQGGVRGRRADGSRVNTRAINGIDQNIGLNRALWSLTEAMANLKK